MTRPMIDQAVDRFIEKCKYGPNTHLPTGTNLFHAGQEINSKRSYT
jgi:hypothetical protein